MYFAAEFSFKLSLISHPLVVGYNFFPMAPMLCRKAVVNMPKFCMLLVNRQHKGDIKTMTKLVL